MLIKGLKNTDVKNEFNRIALNYDFYPYTLVYKAVGFRFVYYY